MEVEVETIREAASDLVTNPTRNDELPGKIGTELESVIVKRWENGGYRNVVRATLSECLKNQEFVMSLVAKFVNNPKIRTNVPAYVADLAHRFIQSNTELLHSPIRENETKIMSKTSRIRELEMDLM